MSALEPVDYQTLPIELFSVTDLTDALGVSKSAELLGTSNRAIYTVRNTNGLSLERMMRLIDAVKADEAKYRQALVVMRNAQKMRAMKKIDAESKDGAQT